MDSNSIKANSFYIIFFSYFIGVSFLVYYVLSSSIFMLLIGAGSVYYLLSLREDNSPKPTPKEYEKLSVCIVGAGASGICMGIKLKEAGIKFRIIEKEEDVGGTWFNNHYPGARCDVVSSLYQYSFFQNPNWSCVQAPSDEIQDYLKRAVKHFGIESSISLGTKLKSSIWNDAAKLWTLKTDKGEVFNVTHLVSSCGALRKPIIPKFPGRETFQGEYFHSSRWHPKIDLKGKKVALIGTGASAVQIAPEIADKVKSLHVFQRTPNWFFPRINPDIPSWLQLLYEKLPWLMNLNRWLVFVMAELFALIWMRKGFPSKVVQYSLAELNKKKLQYNGKLISKLIPNFEVGCKRILLTQDFLPLFVEKKNVHLVTDPIGKLTPTGITTKTGKEHEIDVIIYATGFDVEESVCGFKCVGKRGDTLKQQFTLSQQTHLGISVPDFPNLFLLLGPNTVLVHNSVFFMVECQVNYVVQCLKQMAESNIMSIEVKDDRAKAFKDEMDDLTLTKNISGVCNSWYKSKNGGNFIMWPSNLWHYWWITRKPDILNDFKIVTSNS